MKIKKAVFIICIMLMGLMLCAFTILPGVTFTGSETTVDVTYIGATMDGNAVTVDISYESDGEPFEIVRDIVVATDSSFINTLERKNCVVEEDKYSYEFDVEPESKIDQLYVKPPVLYMPDTLETVTIAAVENAVMKAESGEDWFTIEKIVAEKKDGIICVCVVIDPRTGDLPRYPELVIGEKVYYGDTSMRFDTDGEFSAGQFIFMLPESDLETAGTGNISTQDYATLQTCPIIRISDVLNRVEADQTGLASNVKTLKVIEKTVVK